MKLYYGPGTCAVAVWIALEMMGADYEVEKVDLGSEEYRKINPSGAVPALDTGEGPIKNQAGAILTYLVNKFPEADLGPDPGLEESYEFDRISYFLSADYHPSFWPFFSPEEYTSGKDEADLQKAKEAAYVKIDEAASLLDSMLEGKDHIYKDKKTVLDVYAYILSRWLAFTPKSWTKYPNIKNFMRKVGADPVVKKILAESIK
ncbi:MAG: glutathione S-transferase family protein [Bacillota bacterium]|nr:glutathione S-transferase family protein [Bacillota bacterium]